MFKSVYLTCDTIYIVSLFISSREAWPLDGMKFETLKEQHARRNPEDLEIDYGMFLEY